MEGVLVETYRMMTVLGNLILHPGSKDQSIQKSGVHLAMRMEWMFCVVLISQQS